MRASAIISYYTTASNRNKGFHHRFGHRTRQPTPPSFCSSLHILLPCSAFSRLEQLCRRTVASSSNNFGKTRGLFRRYSLLDEEEGGEQHFRYISERISQQLKSREKNVQFKSLKRSRDSSLGICQHCGYNEKNVMRRGPDGRNNLCNACGLFWKTKGKLRDPRKGRRKNLSIDQSDLDPLIDVNITVLEGELSVIQNEQVAAITSAKLGDCSRDILYMMKRKEGKNILSREKNVQFKSLKQSRDSSLGICEHCGYNEKNVMRRGPDGRNNLCNACGLFWKTKGRLRDPSKGRRKNRSIDQSDLDPLIDVNITVLEGELPVIQNEQVAAITSAKLGDCSRDILYLMKRKEGKNILSREKNVQFKSLKQSRDSSLGICEHCGYNEKNVMRRGPDGRNNLCNACGLFWKTKGKLRDPRKGRRKNLSIDQSDLDPLIDVNITVLEGELPVIQNEQVAAITSAKLGDCSRDILYLMKRKEGKNILSREKNVQFKSLKQSRDSSLGICQHCGYNEKNVMRRGPDGRNNLCNACGLFWKTKGRLRDPSKGRRKNRSIDQSDLDPLIDVNITALEGDLLVIQNEQGISEDPSKAIATEGSNNHALYPNDEELPESLEHLRNTLGIDHSLENDDEQEKGWLLLPKFSEQDVKDPSSAENPESPGKTATEPHNEPALDPGKPQSPMKSFTFSETLVTIESLLAFLDKEVPSSSEVDHTPVVGISR
ncbi:hypothetical protein P8452_19884 [Trifolium repens]|nr:hypothetical protein P8452_19884 [Trifolium repens]